MLKNITASVPAVINYSPDSVILSCIKNSEISFIAATTSSWSYGGEYSILTKKGNQWAFYQYFNPGYRSASNPTYNIIKQKITTKEGEQVLELFIDQDLWNLPAEHDSDCFTYPNQISRDTLRKYSCRIVDSHMNEIITLYQGRITNLKSYYSPDFYESCCPKDSHRSKFVMGFSSIRKLNQNK